MSITALLPSDSPAITRTVTLPSSLFATGMLAPTTSWYRGAIILSRAGRFTHSWKPCMRPPFSWNEGSGISECTTPEPAVIHWTSPGVSFPRLPRESLCSMAPERR